MIETDDGVLMGTDEYKDLIEMAKAYLAICNNRKKLRGVISLLAAGQFTVAEPVVKVNEHQKELRAFAKRLAHDHLGVFAPINKRDLRQDGAQ